MAVTKALNIHLALDLIDYSDVIFFGTSVKPLDTIEHESLFRSLKIFTESKNVIKVICMFTKI